MPFVGPAPGFANQPDAPASGGEAYCRGMTALKRTPVLPGAVPEAEQSALCEIPAERRQNRHEVRHVLSP